MSPPLPVPAVPQHAPEAPGERLSPGLTWCKRCGLLLAADTRPDLDPNRRPCRNVKISLREPVSTRMWVVADNRTGTRLSVMGFLTEAAAQKFVTDWAGRDPSGLSAEVIDNIAHMVVLEYH